MPTNGQTVSRWQVHPAFKMERQPAVRIVIGKMLAHSVSALLVELISTRLAQQVGGCCSTLAAYLTPREQEEPLDLFGVFAWLFDHLPVIAAPEVVTQAEAEGLSPEAVRSLVAARFAAAFAERVEEKQVRPMQEVER